LPEVDWRKASELCSEVFAVQGGVTFEQTASIVQERSKQWSQSLRQLEIRCKDNNLPTQLEQKCRQIAEKLNNISQIGEPNACLRGFLEIADELKQNFPIVRKLEQFEFDRYRTLRSFIQSAKGWDESLEGETAERWKLLSEGINSSDILDRWKSLQDSFSVLQGRYSEEYTQRHMEFQKKLAGAIDELRKHPAFATDPDQAENLLRALKRHQCDRDGSPYEPDFVCPNCRYLFSQMSVEMVEIKRREIEKQLDNLIVNHERPQDVEPLYFERMVESREDIEAIAAEIRRYLFKARKSIKVKINAEPTK
jgi:hypothetical protein